MSNMRELIETATEKGAKKYAATEHSTDEAFYSERQITEAEFKAGCKLPNELLLKACDALALLSKTNPLEDWPQVIAQDVLYEIKTALEKLK